MHFFSFAEKDSTLYEGSATQSRIVESDWYHNLFPDL